MSLRKFGSWGDMFVPDLGRLIAWTVLAFALAASGAVRGEVEGVLPSVERFFENNAFSQPKLAPSGRHLAVCVSKPGSRRFLAVIDLETRKATVAASYSDVDIGNFQWVNDERLLYNMVDLTRAVGDRRQAPGLFAVNRDGSQPVILAETNYVRDRKAQAWNTVMLDQPGSQDSEWIYVEHPYFDKKTGDYIGGGLTRLNTLTAVAEDVPSPNANSFMLDAKGEPRLAMISTEIENALFYRDEKSGKWEKVASYKSYKDARNAITPLGFSPDGTLYVIANAGEDLASLRTFDPVTGKLGKEAVVSTAGYDFTGTLLNNEKLLGIRLTTDARNDIWFDAAMKKIQAAVNHALPKTINLLTVPVRSGSPWILVTSYSDQQPQVYRLYDSRSGQLETIGVSYPNIDPARMARQEPIRYSARDGLVIPGLLTVPADRNRANLPMVVMVHGGPWVRGSSWGWQPESQFLASRGYAVLEVEFRGSTGFGVRHLEAGYRQWGLAMQTDIADGVRWAIAQGIADPHRICIGGASYGGYAALMGLVNDPELYHCAFEWLGVTDIGLMYTGTWYSKPDSSDAYQRIGMPILIGDLEKDADQLAATSPLRQASRIRQPLLLAYGSQDHRVPIHQGKQFYQAVRKANRQVEWIQYDDEGHGWSLAKNRIDFWQRVEQFLYKHIGQGSELNHGS